jgi:hypothetical protein
MWQKYRRCKYTEQIYEKWSPEHHPSIGNVKRLKDNLSKNMESVHMVEFYANLSSRPMFSLFLQRLQDVKLWREGGRKVHIYVFFYVQCSYCMLLGIEILTDGSFVKILSLLKWIYRNCIMCSKKIKVDNDAIVCLLSQMNDQQQVSSLCQN